MSSQTVSGCILGLPHFLETERCGPGHSDPKADTRRLQLGPAEFTGAHRLLPASLPEAPLASCRTWRCGVATQADLDPEVERVELRAPARGLKTGTQALGCRSKLCCELPDCLWVHTGSPALPGDLALWPWSFRSQSRHRKAPTGARWIHRSTQLAC